MCALEVFLGASGRSGTGLRSACSSSACISWSAPSGVGARALGRRGSRSSQGRSRRAALDIGEADSSYMRRVSAGGWSKRSCRPSTKRVGAEASSSRSGVVERSHVDEAKGAAARCVSPFAEGTDAARLAEVVAEKGVGTTRRNPPVVRLSLGAGEKAKALGLHEREPRPGLGAKGTIALREPRAEVDVRLEANRAAVTRSSIRLQGHVRSSRPRGTLVQLRLTVDASCPGARIVGIGRVHPQGRSRRVGPSTWATTFFLHFAKAC